MNKTSTTRYPIHELLAERWSPRAFSEEPVSDEELGSLLEAARWAPSCYNEQPWRFVVAPRSETEGFERLASCLVEGNSWARSAPILLLSVARLTFERNGAANRHALHDVGLAVENLVLQAQALGLSTHQMAGFDVERARQTLGVPDGFEPVCMIAVGHRAEPDTLPDALRERELAPRSRKPLDDLVFAGAWATRPGWLPERA